MEHGIDGTAQTAVGFGEVHADHPDAFVRQAAVQGKLPEEILKGIAKRIEDPSTSVQLAAVRALGRQSGLPDEILTGIAKRLEHLDASVQRAAIYALSKQPGLPDEILEAIAARLVHPDWFVRQAAVYALSKQPSLPDEILKGIAARLENPFASVRQAAVDVLGKQSGLPDGILKGIAKRLEDPNVSVQRAALYVLSKQASLPDEILKAIAARLENLDTSVRQEAVDVLGTRSRLPDKILRDVVARLEDPLSSVRQAAINALYKQSSWPDEIFQSVAARLVHPDWFVREAAIRDLEGAIQTARQAVESTPDDHPDRPRRLSSLGNMLFSRYRRTREMRDLEEAIQAVRQAVESPDDPDRAGRLSNLGNMLFSRYRRTGEMRDLQEANQTAQAVDRAGSLGNVLGRERVGHEERVGREETAGTVGCEEAVGCEETVGTVGCEEAVGCEETVGETVGCEETVCHETVSQETVSLDEETVSRGEETVTLEVGPSDTTALDIPRQLENGHTFQKASSLDDGQRRPKPQSRLAKACVRMLLACIPGGEEPPREGMKRVRWTYFCYRRHYDDYCEARPARDMQEELNKIYGQPMRQYEFFIRQCRRRLSIWTPFWMRSERHRLARLVFQLTVPAAAVASAKLFRSVDPNVAVSLAVYGVVFLTSMVSLGTLLIMTAGVCCGSDCGSDEVDSDAPGTWILALLRDKGGLRYVHLSATKRNTDSALFYGLREKYDRLSGRWRRFSLRQVSAIRFVRFNVTDGKRGDVTARDVWPPEHDPRVWMYEPYPATVPLVGREAVMSLWRDAHHADAAAYEECRRSATWHLRAKDWCCSLPVLFLQVIRDILEDASDANPSKLQTERPAQPRSKYVVTRVPKLNTRRLESEAWGLEVEESFHVHRLLFYILLLYTAGSIALVTWLLRKDLGESDVPVAGMIAWPLTYAGLAGLFWIKWAENCGG